MKSNLLTNILLVIVIVLLVITLIPKNPPDSNRYSMYVQSNQIIKLDKETGRIWIMECSVDSHYEYELGGYIVKIPLGDTTQWQGIVEKR